MKKLLTFLSAKADHHNIFSVRAINQDSPLGGDSNGGRGIAGGPGNETLNGGAGNDILTGGPGNDTLNGGAGDDILTGDGDIYLGWGDPDHSGATDNLGLPITERLNGYSDPGDDVLNGGPGDDGLDGGGGDDRLDGGPGRDHFTGGPGADTFIFKAGETGTLSTSVGNIVEIIYDYDPGEGDKIVLSGFSSNELTWDGGVLTLPDGNQLILASLLDVNEPPAIDGFRYVSGDGGGGATPPADDPPPAGDGDGEQEDDPPPAEEEEQEGDCAIPTNAYTSPPRATDPLSHWYEGNKIHGSPYDDGGGTAGAGAPFLNGRACAEKIYGYEGDDLIYGRAGNDELYGGPGDDTIYGGTGNDRLYGGPGSDALRGEEGNDQLYGGDGDDGWPGEGRLEGGPGNDQLYGGPGRDDLDGGDGNDDLDGGDGGDDLTGGDGADTFIFRAGESIESDTIYDLDPDEGDKIVLSGFSSNKLTFSGGTIGLPDGGRINLFGWGGSKPPPAIADFEYEGILPGVVYEGLGPGPENTGPTITITITWGNDENNQLTGGAGPDDLRGRGGDDVLYGGAGNDRLAGMAGTDRLSGGDGNDTMYGGTGDDNMDGGHGNDRLYAGAGNDYLEGWKGDDRLSGGLGDDTLFGDDGDDESYGGAGDDRLDGEAGDDLLYGGPGNDQLTGGTGDDLLSGGPGYDWMTGEAGADTFRFAPGHSTGGADTVGDTIMDFDYAAGDRLMLTGFSSGNPRLSGLYDADGDGRRDDRQITLPDGGTIALLDVGNADFSIDNIII